MYGVESPILYHGPSAQGRAAEVAASWGRVVGTFGHPRDGLNTEGVREAVGVMSAPTVGDRVCAVVVGPVDTLTLEGIADIFLKTLEEPHPRCPRTFLWAWDIGSVRPTIRSRCLHEWCPGTVPYDPAHMPVAKSVVDAVLSGSAISIVEAMEDVQEDWRRGGVDFLRLVVEVLSKKEGCERFRVWASIRPLLVSSAPSYEEALAQLLP